MTARESRVDPRNLCLAQPQLPGCGILRRMRRIARLRNREKRRVPHKKSQRDLPRACAMRRGDICESTAAFRCRVRKIVVAERAVADERNIMDGAPGEHRVLHCSLLQMIENLVAGDLAFAGHPTASSRSATSKLLTPHDRILPPAFSAESRKRLGERICAAPVQEIAVEAIRPQPLQGALTSS